MNPKSYILLLLSTLLARTAFSQNIEFIENKGQWDHKVLFMGKVSAGAFFIHKDGFTVLQHNAQDWERLHESTHNKGGSENLKMTASDNFVLRSHAYTVDFIGSNPKAQVIPDKPLVTFNNYFIGGDPAQWATNCRTYQGITVKDIYPNVDIRYYSDRGTLKYDLIVNPGGDVSKIALKYRGVDKLGVKNKELVIGTSVGDLKELSPYTYQYREKGRAEIGAKYSVKGDIVRFNIQDYDSRSTLIIDPTLIFCSLSGSAADNWGFTATYGPDGSMFGGGIVFNPGFPTSTGAFQTNYAGGSGAGCFAGGFDIGIIKLSPDGSNRVYATYIGGSADEMPSSLIVDPQGNLVIAGRTNSPDFPMGNGGLIGTGGSWDITLTKLNATGSAIIGSRKIGGTGEDGANINACGGQGAKSLQQNYGDEARSEVILDGAGNIYMASCSRSVADASGQGGFPVIGGFQSVNKGGQNSQDGVLLKFSSDLSACIFSTYLGGSGDDAAYVLAIHPTTNNIYVGGGTASDNLPGPASGTIGSSNQGDIDGFVSIISNDGSTVLKTTYLGTGAIDQVYGIQFDKLGFPYVMGQTNGLWPVQNAAWSQAGGKQFISKLQPDLSAYVYSTTFGKGEAYPDISPVAFLVDRCENVYVSGWGGSIGTGGYRNAGAQGLPVTPDAIKSTPDINATNHLGQDFYFFVLEKNAKSQLYGSYFGQNGGSVGDHVDGGTSRFDENGVIYQAICSNCGNLLPYPTTPGVWAGSKPASNQAGCNLAMVKISFNFAGVGSGVQSSIMGVPRDTAGCVPLTVDFRDTLLQAVSYEWDFGDGSPQITTTVPNTSHTYNAIGTYNVMLVAIDSSTCNIRDTSYLNIKVGNNQALPVFNYKKLDPCSEFRYQFNNVSVAPAGFPFNANTFTWDFGDNTPRVTTNAGTVFHTFSSPGTYNVTLILQDTAYCNSPDSMVQQIRVAALVKADFETPGTGCAPYNAQFNNISAGGSQFTWDFGDGTTSTEVSPIHLYANAGTYIVSLTAVDSATCNITDTKSYTITVYNNPVADFTATPQPPTVNTPISFTNLSSADAIRFKWLFGDGDSLVTTSRAVVEHEYNATAVYNACLVAINAAGCADTVCKQVSTLIEPALDVPNAFTPLSGDINSKIFVRGFGFAKLKFSIWARWGEKVFETNDKRIGWDGRYKGKLLPMDVYAYTVDVEFTDGTKATKKGDITLIR
ncbi:MAG TPA: PKD domain-containing protein [Chitinophagaceae bacterium]|nr:PKD domain-containing protein [Chitinophagaceae bacterium]